MFVFNTFKCCIGGEKSKVEVEDEIIRHPRKMSQNISLRLHIKEVLKLSVVIKCLVGQDKNLKYNFSENRKLTCVTV